jgi:signal transduction histidine kinase
MSERNEIRGKRKDGSEFLAEGSISKLRVENETLFVVMLHDTTERRNAELATLAAKEAAEIADRAKTEFLANMSHELRTPLNAILGFAQMIKAQSFGPEAGERYTRYAEDIYGSGQHLLEIINDILDLSKIEAGRVELSETDIDTSKVIQDCLSLIEARAAESELSVFNEVPTDLPMLRADERLVKQMLLNLLTNAVKFTEGGGRITVGSDLRGDGCLKIFVEDTGIGMTTQDKSKAMSAFGQVDGALNRLHEGTGLGLPLVNHMAELHGGGLEIDSLIGVGTAATIWFPKERVVGGD